VYYLVTGPLEGASLAAQLEDEGTFELVRALLLTRQIGQALRAAHKLNIVHGALSPANVRLLHSSERNTEDARVVGFGGAAFRPPPPAKVKVRNPLPYEAPELARGAVPDARADVFSLGALLFRMLSGALPVVRVGEPPPSLRAACAMPIPPELDALVAHCLEAQPDARLGEIVVLTSTLRELLNIERGDSTRDSLPREADSSVPPPDLSPADGEASGSLMGTDGGNSRGGTLWIVMGLGLALAAVWLLWEMSTRMQPRPPMDRPSLSSP
jgi:serine/threonine-protein kinase